jgi:hypothetical protein
VTVIGITNHSFTEPDILLSATIPADAGYFGERLNAARSELVRAWKTRSAKLAPRYHSTDIIGALALAGQIFAQPSQKILVIYSDMRHRTAGLDLESPASQPGFGRIQASGRAVAVALPRVEVYVLGVDGAGKSLTHWESLRGFWADSFRASGATMKEYSVLRFLPELR